MGMKVVGIDPSGQAGESFVERMGATYVDSTDKTSLNKVDMCISFSLHAGRAEISRLYPRNVPLSISLNSKDCGGGDGSVPGDGRLQPWVVYALEKVQEGSFFVINRHRLACTIVRGAESPLSRHGSETPEIPGSGAEPSTDHSPARALAEEDPQPSIAKDITSRLPAGWLPAAGLSEAGQAAAVWRAPVLHDLLVHRAPSPTTVQALLHIGGRSVATIVSDGMCLATPSGSSGYARTVGAAAVDAGMSAVYLCPINPNSLAFRPMVLPGSTKLAFTFQSKRPDRKLTFTLDGRPADLYTGDCLLLDAAPPMPYIRMLRLDGVEQHLRSAGRRHAS